LGDDVIGKVLGLLTKAIAKGEEIFAKYSYITQASMLISNTAKILAAIEILTSLLLLQALPINALN
jgi:hypothetical protein